MCVRTDQKNYVVIILHKDLCYTEWRFRNIISPMYFDISVNTLLFNMCVFMFFSSFRFACVCVMMMMMTALTLGQTCS